MDSSGLKSGWITTLSFLFNPASYFTFFSFQVILWHSWNIWVSHKLWITSDSDSLNGVSHPFLSHAQPKPWTCKSQLVPKLWVGDKEKISACAICSCTTTLPLCLQTSAANSVFSLPRRHCKTNWTTCLSMFFNRAVSLPASLYNLFAWSETAQMPIYLSQESERKGSSALSLLISFLDMNKGLKEEEGQTRGVAWNTWFLLPAQKKLLQSKQRYQLYGAIFQ